jgi:hypothetical protein
MRDIKQWKPQRVGLSVTWNLVALSILIMGIVGWKRSFRNKANILSQWLVQQQIDTKVHGLQILTWFITANGALEYTCRSNCNWSHWPALKLVNLHKHSKVFSFQEINSCRIELLTQQHETLWKSNNKVWQFQSIPTVSIDNTVLIHS